MTFPFSFHANFETGSKDTFDSESDSGNRMDYPGPAQLLGGAIEVFPSRGAFCMRVNLGKNSTDAYVSETVDWAADSVNYASFKFMIGDDVQIGNVGDLVDVMVLRSASADEGAITLTRTSEAGLVLGVRDAAGAVSNYFPVSPGDWLCLEPEVSVDAGGGNDGHLVLRHSYGQIQITNLDQAALTGVRFGAINQTGDFRGHLYFDEVIFDTARLQQDLGPNNWRLNGETMPIFKSGWVFVGAGSVMGLELVDGGSNDCTMKVYDTAGLFYAEAMKKGHLVTASGRPTDRAQAIGDTPLFNVDHGCYVVLSGTNPHGFVRVGVVNHLVDMTAESIDDDGGFVEDAA